MAGMWRICLIFERWLLWEICHCNTWIWCICISRFGCGEKGVGAILDRAYVLLTKKVKDEGLGNSNGHLGWHGLFMGKSATQALGGSWPTPIWIQLWAKFRTTQKDTSQFCFALSPPPQEGKHGQNFNLQLLYIKKSEDVSLFLNIQHIRVCCLIVRNMHIW